MSRPGEAIRTAIVLALPATVSQIVVRVGRHRTTVIHHLDILLHHSEVEADYREYPTVYRVPRVWSRRTKQ